MTPKENYLAAIRFRGPEYVPMGNEGILHAFQFAGNFRCETWTDGWGVHWEQGLAGTVPFPKGNPLPSLDRLADYRFPDPGALEYTSEIQAGLAVVDRGEKLIIGNLTYLLFERAWAIMGMENFLMALVTHPAEAHAFLHGIAGYARGVFERYLELGVDGVGFSEDLGTQRALMISPDMFREFILPEYRFIFENVLRAGKIINFHSCGCVQDIAADLAGIGVTILNPIQHRANDLHTIKQAAMGGAFRGNASHDNPSNAHMPKAHAQAARGNSQHAQAARGNAAHAHEARGTELRGRMALQGAIDTAVLAMGTPADVRAEVESVMAVLKPGGGYICQPDQGIPGIPPENTEALWEAARDLGRY